MRATALGAFGAVLAGAGVGAVVWLRRRFAVVTVLGDNPNHSYDSRQYGYITEAQVLGLAVRPMGHTPQRANRPPPRTGRGWRLENTAA